MLNKFVSSGHGEAQVQYLDGDFRVISPGTYVRCAITDARIPLDELKYWSVDLQRPTRPQRRAAAAFSRRAEVAEPTRFVGWAKARLRRAHHLAKAAILVGTLRFAHPATGRATRETFSRAP